MPNVRGFDWSIALLKILAPLSIAQNIPGITQPPSETEFPALPGDTWGGSLPAPPSLPALPNFPSLTDFDPNKLTKDFAGQRQDPKPGYFLKGIFSLPDYRLGSLTQGKWPLLEVIDADKWRLWQQNAAKCRSEKNHQSQECPQYEWTVPMSLEGESKDAATGIRRAWQRFEERYWWRAQTALNAEAAIPINCWAGLGQGNLNPTPATVKTTVDSQDIPATLRGKIKTSQPENELHLDSYSLFPQVPSSDFCDSLGWHLSVTFIPGGCTYVFGMKTFCLQGNDRVTGPGVAPLYFNMGEAQNRVFKAMQHAATVYYPQYQLDVLKELTPPKRKALFMLPWSSHAPSGGAMIAPVMNQDVSLTQFHKLSQRAGQALGGLYQITSPLYYFQGIKRARALDIFTLPGRNDLLKSPPGVWKFEEFKRELGPSNPLYYELFGYTTFFQVWNQLDTTILPEVAAARSLRILTYWATAIDTHIDFSGVKTVPVPTGVLVPPYNLPFFNYRVHFTWTSAPEGYNIPRVQGSPTLDYQGVMR
jgi:hypothetical protein